MRYSDISYSVLILDHRESTAFNEREAHYESQIKAEREQSLLQIQDLQSQLTDLSEEKINNEREIEELLERGLLINLLMKSNHF